MNSVMNAPDRWPKRRRAGGYARGSGSVGAVPFSRGSSRQTQHLLGEIENFARTLSAIVTAESTRGGMIIVTFAPRVTPSSPFAEIVRGHSIRARLSGELITGLHASGWLSEPASRLPRISLPRNEAEAAVVRRILTCAHELAQAASATGIARIAGVTEFAQRARAIPLIPLPAGPALQ